MNLSFLVCLMIVINYAKSIVNAPKNAIETNKATTPGNIIYKSYANQIFGLADTEKQTTQKYLPINNSSYNLQSNNNLETRTKRNAINLYNMLSCATGCNPLIYKGYGCYCGFLGSGFPVDGIDRCCRSHDWCYVHANCPFYYLEYFIPYHWQCFDNIPICSNNGIFGGSNTCSYRLCECDRRLSNCLKKYACPSYRAYCETSPWRFAQNILMNF